MYMFLCICAFMFAYMCIYGNVSDNAHIFVHYLNFCVDFCAFVRACVYVRYNLNFFLSPP